MSWSILHITRHSLYMGLAIICNVSPLASVSVLRLRQMLQACCRPNPCTISQYRLAFFKVTRGLIRLTQRTAHTVFALEFVESTLELMHDNF